MPERAGAAFRALPGIPAQAGRSRRGPPTDARLCAGGRDPPPAPRLRPRAAGVRVPGGLRAPRDGPEGPAEEGGAAGSPGGEALMGGEGAPGRPGCPAAPGAGAGASGLSRESRARPDVPAGP